MSHRSARLMGRRAIAALVATAVVSTGTVVVNAPFATAQTQSVTGESPRGEANGSGAGTLSTSAQVEAGGLLTVSGTGFDQRPAEGGFIALKLNDGSLALPADQAGADATNVDVSGTAYLEGESLPDASGNFSATVRLPDDLATGDYWLRLLSGSDGGQLLTKYIWFEVVDEVEEGEGEEQAPAEDGLNITGGTSSDDGSASVNVEASGFAAGATLSATAGSAAASFQSGRSTAETVEADENGNFSGTVVLPAGAAAAGEAVTITVTDGTTSLEAVFTGTPGVTFSDERGTSDTALGTTVSATVANLPADAKVTFIGAGETNFISGDVAAVDGVAEIDEVVIPDTAALLDQSITVKYTVGGETKTAETGASITPATAASNVDSFTMIEQKVASGLYQTAFSEKENAIYVTRSVGRPPVTESTIFKLDADTLEVLAEVTPPVADEETEGLFAAYGVDVDDTRGLLWITNTRQNTVSVYKTSDLSLVKQFEEGEAGHSRDVLVDETTGLAYVSTPRQDRGYLEVFSGETLEKVDTIELPGLESTMSLDFDHATGELVTVDLNTPTAAKIDVRDGNKVTYYDLPADDVISGSGIALDTKNRNIWIASQDTNNVVVWNLDEDKLVAELPTGAGALNSEYDPVNELVYVINRGGGSVNVFDANSLEQVAVLPVGGNANHVATDGRGNVFTVNKTNETLADGTTVNSVFRITPDEELGGDNGGSNSGTISIGSSLGNGLIKAILALLSLIGLGGTFNWAFNLNR